MSSLIIVQHISAHWGIYLKRHSFSNVVGAAAVATVTGTVGANAQALPSTDTFSSSDTPLRIPETGTAGTITSTITVNDPGTTIDDLDVDLDLNHSWFGDLDVSLQSPEGTSVILFTDVGSSSDPNGLYTLDDDATAEIGSSTTPGRYTTETSEGLLSSFNGENPNGDWTLTIVDDAGADDGTLNVWRLIFTLSGIGAIKDDIQSTAATLSRLAVGGAAKSIGLAADNSFATRDAQRMLGFSQPAGTEQVTVSSKNGRLVGNTYAWAELSGFELETSGNSDYRGVGLRVGIDKAMSSDLIAGVSLGYSDVSGSTSVASTSGDIWFIQPYLGYRSGPWEGEVSLVYGQGDYTQTSVGGIGQADSDIWAVNLAVDRHYMLADGNELTSVSTLRYGEEDVTGRSGTLAGAGSSTLSYTEVSTGVRWTNPNIAGAPYVGLHVDYLDSDASDIVPGQLGIDGFSGRLEFGGEFQLSDTATLGTGVELGGIGTNFTEYNGFVSLVIQF